MKRNFSLDATHAPAGDGRVDQNRPAEFLGPGRDVERVEGVGVHGTSGGDRLGLGGDVERAGGRVDNGRAGDADLGGQVTLPGLSRRDGGDALRRVDEAIVPERGAGFVGVEGVDTVVLGGDEDDVVNSLARDRHASHVEGLGVDRAVDRVGELHAEVRRVDVRRVQDRLIEVLAGPRVIVVISEDVGGRGRQEPPGLDLLRVGTKQLRRRAARRRARGHGKRPSRMEGLKGISPSMRSVRTFSSSSDSHHDRAASVRTLATQYGKKAKLMRGMESGPTGSTPIDKHLRADLHAEERIWVMLNHRTRPRGFVRAPTPSLRRFDERLDRVAQGVPGVAQPVLHGDDLPDL